MVGALPRWRDARKTVIDAEARRGKGYEFLRLSQGVTAYRWHGPARGPVVVAVHGLTTPSQVWDGLIPHLTALGYRVLSYDLYGRGLSDAPSGRQTAAFFQRQLSDLLDDQGLNEDVTLLGYSMGGSIVTGFAASSPHRVAKVVLVASGGIRMAEDGFDQFCRKVPLLGDWVAGMFMESRLRQELEATGTTDPIDKVRAEQLDRAGYIPAVHSSRRYQLADVQRPEHRILGREDIPVFAVWGEQDKVIPISALGRLAQWNRTARQDMIEGAGHDLMQTHPEEVSNAIRDLLVGKPSS